MVPLDLLRTSELFNGLSDDELAPIARMARQESFGAGDQMFGEHDPAENLYVVITGRVGVLIDIGRGRQTVVDTVGPDSSFGWSALVPPYFYTGAAKCLETTRVLVVPGEDLRSLCMDNCRICHTIMQRLASIISARLRDTRVQLIGLMYG
jgi:CRP/FNR family transcriptional regulator, cyclic AMP receptor protein